MSRLFRLLACSCLVCLASAVAQKASVPATIAVPLSYEEPSLGATELTLDYAAPFDPAKPTVLVIADGQQFYVRKGSMKELQQSTLGEAVNVVGIVTRGTTPAFIDASLRDGKPDWLKAWKVFNSAEWLGDIESVRKALVGDQGRIDLYGRSGGAYLVHQYLAQHPDRVERVFTQSAVNPYLNAELGISLDTFWSDLGRKDARLQVELQSALKAHPEERIGILMTLQRQHFFVSADKVDAARADLIHALSTGNMAAYRTARKAYEVDDMAEMYASNEIIPQNVRVLELIAPSGAFDRLGDGALYPLAETQAFEIRPLLDLLHAGKINLSPFDFAALHRCPADVFILAGRYDEAVDYRTAIALASAYPHHFLFLADDNHVFSALSSAGASRKLISSFFAQGLQAQSFAMALRDAQQYRWIEQ
jgi:pimeloyl-ACP methyl ester carboxylesterase